MNCLHESQLLARAVLFSALFVGAALRLYLAFTDDGIYWPDEIYQSVEPAHRLVFGYGLMAWEFIEGARNWALPGLIALLLKAAEIVGLDSPHQYMRLLKAVFAFVGIATAYGSYRLAKTYGATELSAATGGALMALIAPGIYFSPRAMSETAAALPVVLGFAYGLTREPKRGEHLIGAALLGIAVLLRLQCGIFCIGFLGILAARRQWRRVGECLGIMLGIALLLGLLDHLTWAQVPGARLDGWFHSAVKYLQFNLIENRARDWGVSPWHYYVSTLFRAMPGPLLFLVGLSLLAARCASGLFLTALAFIAVHAYVPHKELRFIVPALPLYCALAAIGLSTVRHDFIRRIATASVLLVSFLSAIRFHTLTFGDLGQYPERAWASAYDDFGAVNRMLLTAHDQPDICGIRVEIAHLPWTGGHSYLHRAVPIYDRTMPPHSRQPYNYLITRSESISQGSVVARDPRNPRVVLLRIADECESDSQYSWRLP